MTDQEISFDNLGLAPEVVDAVHNLGYETPTPIQIEAIPLVLKGTDLIAQAQTGTGKTAAFALPLLSRIDAKLRCPQVLVLTPTRELSIQVSEAFQSYAKKTTGFHVVPIYGGQDYRQQLRALDRGVHVVVGTPGRVMDHIRKGTLKLESLSCLVLDEADEMLRMGFIDDVEWVLQQIPNEHQTVLFSATMPSAIKKIANTYLKTPEVLNIKVKKAEANLIHQHYCRVTNAQKMDALTRILEIEETDGSIVFVRTKTQTVELKDKLLARGFAVDALNGDVAQRVRELVVNQFRKGKLDVLIATDVAARGLDVPRTSHVINYDAPYDIESYIHRIGRTGRAGKEGDAILFITPRENRLLKSIERATQKTVELMKLPSNKEVNVHRIAQFKQRITEKLSNEDDLAPYVKVIESYQSEHDVPEVKIAAALVSMIQGDGSLLLENPNEKRPQVNESDQRRSRNNKEDRKHSKPRGAMPGKGMQRFRIEVGRDHQVKPGNIVGAIANEAGVDSEHIGEIEIYDTFSTVDLPDSMPKSIQQVLKKTRVCGKPLNLTPQSKEGFHSSDRKYQKKSKDERGFKSSSKGKGFGKRYSEGKSHSHQDKRNKPESFDKKTLSLKRKPKKDSKRIKDKDSK